MSKYFTREKDSLLREIIQIYGTKNWYFITNEFNRQLKQKYGSSTFSAFTARQCRERWNNFIDHSKIYSCSEWSEDENRILMMKHKEYGENRRIISQFFPNRTFSSVKNHYIQLKRSGMAHLYMDDSNYESADTSPTYQKTRRQTYCPSSFRVTTKQQMYFKNCTSRNSNCKSPSQCYFLGRDGHYQACSKACFTCPDCLYDELSVFDTEIDHIIPVAHYLDHNALRKTAEQIADWYNNTDNLQVLCKHCNRHKSDKI